MQDVSTRRHVLHTLGSASPSLSMPSLLRGEFRIRLGTRLAAEPVLTSNLCAASGGPSTIVPLLPQNTRHAFDPANSSVRCRSAILTTVCLKESVSCLLASLLCSLVRAVHRENNLSACLSAKLPHAHAAGSGEHRCSRSLGGSSSGPYFRCVPWMGFVRDRQKGSTAVGFDLGDVLFFKASQKPE